MWRWHLPGPPTSRTSWWWSATFRPPTSAPARWSSAPINSTSPAIWLPAPTSQALIVDVNTWDGAAYTTAFTTKPQLSAGSTIGGSTPDATYARRCFNPFYSGASLSAGQIINFDVDQVGSGVAGADLDIFVRIKQYIRPLEAMLIYND